MIVLGTDLTIGKMYSISLKALYESGVTETEQGYKVEKTQEGKRKYYDLIDSYDARICCDGEVCTFVEMTKSGDCYIFKNVNNGVNYFRLTQKEVDIAVFR